MPMLDEGLYSDLLRVLLVDTNYTFAELLARALATIGMVCVGRTRSADEGVEMTRRRRPDLVVIDIEMPEQDGLAAIRRIRAARPKAAVAVVTGYQDAGWVAPAANAGACAFISKHGPLAEVLDMLSRARRGLMLVAPSVYAPRAAVEEPPPSPDDLPMLTRRERDVLGLMCQGMPVKAIATELGIAPDTCRGTVSSLEFKLGTHTQLATVMRAQELGFGGPRRRRSAAPPPPLSPAFCS